MIAIDSCREGLAGKGSQPACNLFGLPPAIARRGGFAQNHMKASRGRVSPFGRFLCDMGHFISGITDEFGGSAPSHRCPMGEEICWFRERYG